MQVKKVGEQFLVRLEEGEEVVDSLRAWADQYGVGFAAVWAIGALRRATLGYWDPAVGTYQHLQVDEQVEVVSLSGNISRGEDGQPVPHMHVTLGRAGGQTVGGHLIEGAVFPTLEVVLFALPATVVRKPDAATGLVLWNLA